MNDLPKPGSRWQDDITGKPYTVLDVCNQAAPEALRHVFPLIVAYYDEDRNVWARRLDNFLHVMVEIAQETE